MLASAAKPGGQFTIGWLGASRVANREHYHDETRLEMQKSRLPVYLDSSTLGGAVSSLWVRSILRTRMTDKLAVELTRDEAIGITWACIHGPLLTEWSTFHGIAEYAVGHPIYTHEFPSMVDEIDRLWEGVKERANTKKRR